MREEVPSTRETQARPGLSGEALMKLKVERVMNPRPRTVGPDTSIDDLIERLRQQIEDCFPVVDKDQKLVGIVTESDMLHILYAPTPPATVGGVITKNLVKQTASNVCGIMTKPAITATPEMTIEQTLNIMGTRKLRHLPVVEGEKLVGLICLRDILNLYRLVR